MRRIDGTLSKRAQRIDATALVFQEEAGTYTLERRDADPVSLGDSFGRAQSALEALRISARDPSDPAPVSDG